MDLSIRKAVLANLNNSTYDDIKKTILDSIKLDEEKVLPGLGVIFELYWSNCSDEEKEHIIGKITNAVN